MKASLYFFAPFLICLVAVAAVTFLISVSVPASKPTPFENRKRLALASQEKNPTMSFCQRCGLTWADVEPHDTYYHTENYNYPPSTQESDQPKISSCTYGIFPLCEYCWSELTPEERLPYYRRVWELWHKYDPIKNDEEQWRQIEKAVLEGK